MNIALFSLDRPEFPSSQIRLIEPLRSLGSHVRLYDGMQMVQQKAPFDSINILAIQRSFPRPQFRPLCESILGSGKPVIYETDDLLQRVPAHHNKPDYNEALSQNIEWLAREVDVVTVSTPVLADYYSQFAREVVLLPNYLSPRLWSESLLREPSGDRARVRIGLVGSKNHDRDFALVAGLIEETLTRYPQVDCVFYGAAPAEIALSERVSLVPANYVYEQHPERLSKLGIDIALVPLAPSRFNRAKSNIKFLEFGFLGIPGLYADLEPYQGTVRHGDNGFLCGTTPAAWRHALFGLIEDAELRQRIGQRARETVLASHMLSEHANKWTTTCQLAINNRLERLRSAGRT